MKPIVLIIVILLIKLVVCNAQVNIIVNRGPFATVQQASAGEDKVNFYDNDLDDDRGCTESFAAMEFAKKYIEQSLIDSKNIVGQQRLLERVRRFE